MKKYDSNGFTLIELLVVVGILSILIGSSYGSMMTVMNKTSINTDINNAEFCNNMLNLLATSDETIQQWASISDETHVVTWNDSGKKSSITETGMILEDLIDMEDFMSTSDLSDLSNYSLDYLISDILSLPVSQTGDGFMMIVSRDGNGKADFHTYAMCDLSQSDLEALKVSYNISDEYWSIISGKGGK